MLASGRSLCRRSLSRPTETDAPVRHDPSSVQRDNGGSAACCCNYGSRCVFERRHHATRSLERGAWKLTNICLHCVLDFLCSLSAVA